MAAVSRVVTCGHGMGLGWCRDGDGDKHEVGKRIGMMEWHRGRGGMGLGMVRRLGWYEDGIVAEWTWHGLGDGMRMGKEVPWA